MPIEREIVENDLILLDELDNSEDFVAIGIMVNDQGVGYHSGLIICLNEQFYFFHYTGQEVLLEPVIVIPADLYAKKLQIFGPEKVEYFKGFCEILLDEVQPQYGWVFTDSFYVADGTYYSESGMPDITTCVGFCINVIRGALYNNEVYIATDQWDNSTLNQYQEGFMELIESQLARLENIDPERLAVITESSFKRIMPSELTSSAFFEVLPITKANVDYANPTVVEVIIDKHVQQADEEVDNYDF